MTEYGWRLKGFGYLALWADDHPSEYQIAALKRRTVAVGQSRGLMMGGVWVDVLLPASHERPQLRALIGEATSERPCVAVVLNDELVAPIPLLRVAVVGELVTAGLGFVNLRAELVPA